MTTPLAPRSSKEAIAWERDQRHADNRYPGECLILQRSARGIPSLAPTAFAASILVPMSERKEMIRNYMRGMVGFSKGDNPAGHIFQILGHKKGFDRDDPDGVVTSSNDVIAERPGAIGIVPLSFYTDVWGHELQFAATWLNGYDFADFNAKPKPPAHLGQTYQHAIKDMEAAIEFHKKKGHTVLVHQLQKDLAHMRKLYHNWQ